MQWYELEIETTPAGEDGVSSVIIEAGITGYETVDTEFMKRHLDETKDSWDYIDDELMNSHQDNVIIRFYVPKDEYSEKVIAIISTELQRLRENDFGVDFGSLLLSSKNVDDKNWLDNWKKFYKPFRVGENIVIKPTWESYLKNSNDIVFNINPGHVFGTGLHQSTKMCMMAIEKYITKGDDIADLGCGSGILSILALMLGANTAFACDIESPAYDIAYENADLNNINKENYTVKIGNILTDEQTKSEIRKKRYDIVIANIVADVIIALVPEIPHIIKENGYFICSGIIKGREDDVIKSFGENYQIIKRYNMDEWICFVTKYKGEIKN